MDQNPSQPDDARRHPPRIEPRRIDRRLFLALGAALWTAPAMAACPAPRVLFVCPVGTVKSVIARETLRRRASQRGMAVIVRSRGVQPQDHVSPGLAARLKADGIDPRSDPILALSPGDVAEADIVVVFDEAAQAPGLENARAWTVPSWNTQYDEARAALAPQIEALIDELQRRPCAP